MRASQSAGSRRFPRAALLLAALVCGAPLHAEQRALLVGVGRYETQGIDLPGIDLDLERMREALGRLGFKPEQIHTLADEEATSANVLNAFRTWLKQGVRPEDRVVFYFSGHGSNIPDTNGDEDDGVDEVLVTHDMHRARIKGRASLTGVVVDDQIAAQLRANPSRNIWIIVDACHSGTITRSFTMQNRSITSEPVFVKSYSYAGMPEGGRLNFSRAVTASAKSTNYVSLTAASDKEKAVGTMKGGIFTIGLTQAITKAAEEGKRVNINELRAEAAAYIAEKVDRSEVHHPQVNGNPALAQDALAIESAALEQPNRKRLLELVAAQPQKLSLSASQPRYTVEEPITLTVTIPAAGYLNVVTVDAQDTATVLFPNHYQESNAVTPGALSIPTPQMSFDLLAAEPHGTTLVVAFLSPDPVNFYQETLDGRDDGGRLAVDFSKLSHSATRAIRVAPRRTETAAGELEMEIVPAASH